MKKSIIFGSFALTLLVGGLFARPNVYAKAETNADILLAPNSYQQYLELESPVDVAVSDRYTAIADVNRIHLYDGADELYRTYTHEYNLNNPLSNNISKLQFDDDGNLYFLDQHELFVLPFDDLNAPAEAVAMETNFSCTTFLVVEDTLYFTDAKAGNTQLLKTAIDKLIPNKQQRETIVGSGLTGIPSLAHWNGDLYFTRTNDYAELYKLNLSSELQQPVQSLLDLKIAEFRTGITAIAVAENTLAVTFTDKSFSTYALPRATTETLIQTQEGAFTALCAYDNFFYAVNANAVWQYSLSANAFTDFEVCANSAQPNRLSGAAELLQVEDQIFIADNDNARISVFDTQTNTFTNTFNAHMPTSFLSSDGKILCAANAEQVCLYALDDERFGTICAQFNSFSDPIVGVASVYGKHYFATATHTYSITFDESANDFVLTAAEKLTFHPSLLSADVYGNLYTFKSGQLYAFTEEEFMSPNGMGTAVLSTSESGFTKLVFDYEGNAYALKNNLIYNLSNGTQYAFYTPLVYTKQATVSSFTIGVEENAGYILMNGNHLIQTQRLQLPTVKTVKVEDADEQIFSTQSAAVEVVRVQENALLVEFDLSALNGAEYFPYVAYCRSEQTLTALQLGTTNDYALIAVFNERENAYHTYAVKNRFCTTLDQNEYFVDYVTSKQAWTTNTIRLYKFPYLTSLLTVEELPRGTQITLLGELNELDHDYYFVAFTNEQGELVRGYIPKAYCTAYDASPTPPEQTLVGNNNPMQDEVWRLVYILLGFAIICILVDFLLLRKTDEDEE